LYSWIIGPGLYELQKLDMTRFELEVEGCDEAVRACAAMTTTTTIIITSSSSSSSLDQLDSSNKVQVE